MTAEYQSPEKTSKEPGSAEAISAGENQADLKTVIPRLDKDSNALSVKG